MSIFHDQHGLPIKFFIQKDLPQEIQTEVCEAITSLGGRVESKVPRVGYILVQPGTTEEERLRICWASPDRPERFFVPYTFVDTCKINGALIKQIFFRDGQPIRMHIDSSIANVNVRATLSQRIMHSGGDPSASAQNAQVILADPNTEIFQTLVKTYQSQPDKFVESYLWVKKCVERGQVLYTPMVYKNPGGRRAGEERTHFTEEDEANLCNWIALKIPFKETGGRTGNRLYQQLVDMANTQDYAWVTRHTWQSWRERYKKNSARLDPKIAEIVERNKPPLGAKGQYGYIRKPEEKLKKPKKKSTDGEENAIAGSSKDEVAFLSHALVIPPLMGSIAGVNPLLPLPVSMPPAATSSAVPISPAVLAARQNASEEEDDEVEWQIREGTGPTPAWAKRKASSEEEEKGQGPQKKARQTPHLAEVEAILQNSAAGSSTAATMHPKTAASLHVVDQAILDIAQKFRFTAGEVKEYYDKCGDLNRTTSRFARMREVLTNLPDDDESHLLPMQALAAPLTTVTLGSESTKPETMTDDGRLLHNIMKGVT
ncbi:hypothetical protein BC835DRAFT_1468497 [Cytidiella melzeri]|nr:hypothetical protein BC835DRAFT_1468497 [Cytidiella melzeri]